MSLSQPEITARLIELRNLRQLYAAQKLQNEKLRAENQALKARIKELEADNQAKDQRITDLELQMAELRTMVFGKQKTKADTADRDDDTDGGTPPKTVN